MVCRVCTYWDFKNCQRLLPCPEVKSETTFLGIITKPKSGPENPDGNIEAVFIEYSQETPSEFYKLAFSLAKKRNLGFLTMPEFDLLGKVPISLDRRRIRLDPFDNNKSVLCPLNWVQETKIIKKFCHRLYCQSLELSEDFLQWIVKENGHFSELTFDKRKLTAKF